MKEKVNQMFKDKLFLVMLVLGLLTVVSAAGVLTIQKGKQTEESPYLEIPDPGNVIAEGEDSLQIAGASNANPVEPEVVFPKTEVEPEVLVQDTEEVEEQVAQVGANKDAAQALVLNFSDTSKMSWPIQGNVVLDYNMESTVYFPTLDQYKCNPGVVIQGEVSMPVYAPVNARVESVNFNEEIGNYVLMDLGNGYQVICGQMKEIQVVANEYMEAGKLIGYVAEPTKYYSIEGTNIYFELMHEGKTLDPIDYLN